MNHGQEYLFLDKEWVPQICLRGVYSVESAKETIPFNEKKVEEEEISHHMYIQWKPGGHMQEQIYSRGLVKNSS